MSADILKIRNLVSTDQIDVYTGLAVFVLIDVVLIIFGLIQLMPADHHFYGSVGFFTFMILFCLEQLSRLNLNPCTSYFIRLNYRIVEHAGKWKYIIFSGLVYSFLESLILLVLPWGLDSVMHMSPFDYAAFVAIYTLGNFLPEGKMNYDRYAKGRM